MFSKWNSNVAIIGFYAHWTTKKWKWFGSKVLLLGMFHSPRACTNLPVWKPCIRILSRSWVWSAARISQLQWMLYWRIIKFALVVWLCSLGITTEKQQESKSTYVLDIDDGSTNESNSLSVTCNKQLIAQVRSSLVWELILADAYDGSWSQRHQWWGYVSASWISASSSLSRINDWAHAFLSQEPKKGTMLLLFLTYVL